MNIFSNKLIEFIIKGQAYMNAYLWAGVESFSLHR